jgi:hypothetical protein
MEHYNTFLGGGRATPLTAQAQDNTNKYPGTDSFISPYFINSLIQELDSILTEAGDTFDNSKTDQLLTAIQTIGGGSATATVQTTGFTASFGGVYLCKVGGGGFTATLPATPTSGDDGKTITFIKSDSGLNGNTLTIGRNGEDIMGDASDLLIEESDGENIKIILIWDDTASEWVTAV